MICQGFLECETYGYFNMFSLHYTLNLRLIKDQLTVDNYVSKSKILRAKKKKSLLLQIKSKNN